MYKARPDRPVTLPLLSLRLPLAGWVSFLHRVSGVLLFLCLPLALLALDRALSGPEAFDAVRDTLAQPTARLLALAAVWALAHHLFAGIRHLLMDLHFGVSLATARRSALAVALGGGLVALVTAWRLFA
ncbi:succinate dehydrogenase, cytochrome b556 subunit [Betaproteobacteria bacterium SCN2]|jgi:succinate dehydrogenase / fumarate reductase cytochrome b subunit|nr:succinate dehydrogenase, cytochrome b556 subunit [Betaproteobacteria bacterium SCN2]